MKDRTKKVLFAGTILLAAFVLWTILIQCIDVQKAGLEQAHTDDRSRFVDIRSRGIYRVKTTLRRDYMLFIFNCKGIFCNKE